MKNLSLLSIALLAFAVVGCRPYAAPDIVEITPSQTAYLIPLDEDTVKQEKFKSEKYLREQQVAATRVEITKRWFQTGYGPFSGKYIPTARLIVVERKPVTKNWTDIAAESAESIGFSAELTVVANIPEDGASKFLYNYNNKSLDDVLDEEIKSKINGKFVEECSKRTLQRIFAEKSAMISVVRESVIPFFKEKGIQITNLDFKGNLTFESPEIQKSINDVQVASQKRKEQEDLNAAARAKAVADREIAAQLTGPVALQLKNLELRTKELELRKLEIENQKLWIEAWAKGGAQVPTWVTGSAGNNFLMSPPTKK